MCFLSYSALPHISIPFLCLVVPCRALFTLHYPAQLLLCPILLRPPLATLSYPAQLPSVLSIILSCHASPCSDPTLSFISYPALPCPILSSLSRHLYPTQTLPSSTMPLASPTLPFPAFPCLLYPLCPAPLLNGPLPFPTLQCPASSPPSPASTLTCLAQQEGGGRQVDGGSKWRAEGGGQGRAGQAGGPPLPPVWTNLITGYSGSFLLNGVHQVPFRVKAGNHCDFCLHQFLDNFICLVHAPAASPPPPRLASGQRDLPELSRQVILKLINIQSGSAAHVGPGRGCRGPAPSLTIDNTRKRKVN